MASIEIRKDKRGQFRFSIKSRNGETIATGESYAQKAKAMATARSLAGQLAKAKLVDLTATPAKSAPDERTSKDTSKKANTKKPASKAAPKKPSGKSKGNAAAKTAPPSAAKKTPRVRPSAGAKPATRSIRGMSEPTSPTSKQIARQQPRAGDDRQPERRDELSPAEAEPIRTPASAARERARRVVSRGDETRPTDTDDDLDTVAQAEGNDVVRADRLGDGDLIADAVRPAGPNSDRDTGGGDDSANADEEAETDVDD